MNDIMLLDLSRKRMQLLPYWVRWMHGSSAPFFFREAVTPLKMYIMSLILSGLLLPFMVKYSNLFQHAEN